VTNVPYDSEPQSLTDLAWIYAPGGMFAFDTNTGILINVNPAAAALRESLHKSATRAIFE
jgi:hypothetical protein